MEKVNFNGGVIVFGYLIGVIGVILMIKLVYELCCMGGSVGVVIMCIGGG